MKKKELYKIFKEIKNKNLFSDEEIQTFTDNLSKFLRNIRIHSNNEENLKNDLKEFLSKFLTNYINNKPISICGISATDIDLAIFDASEKIENDKVRVIFETKQPISQDMINGRDFNRKSMHETILYYLIEKNEFKNDLIENIIITDYLNWFIINSEDYKINFFNNKKIVQIYQEYRNRKGDGTVNSTNYFYSECKKLLSNNPSILDNLSCVHIDLSKLGDIFKIDPGRNYDSEYDSELTIKEFLIIFRYILSPPFLLHESIAYRNANQLNKTFYNILLNIIGVEEKKEENKLKIVLDKTNKDSLIQKIIEKISRKKIISSKEKEQEVFEHALGICLVWINRLLFIKLLEAYLLKINCPTKDLEEYYIISKKKIKDFNDLDNLFFDILAKEKHDVDIFKHVPYLNSSLFELSDLEKTYSITIGDFHDYSVKNNKMLEVYSKLNKRKIAQENFVNLIIDFLNFYDFGSEKESHKTDNLINASVLGLIFEKINGYKEGSYYTPSQVTEFISKETISRAVLDKINLYLKKHSKLEQNSLNSLKNLIIRNKDDNDFLLGISEALYDIKICDPAVGSGHFLVSALNDLLMIRCDLGLTFGKERNYVKLYCEYDDFRELQFYKDYECKKEVKYTRDNLSFNYQEEQETIFYIKKRVIESSLYGVDINPNSIEICHLRLWIELLKNVYYKDGKMETLPNIDINIKPGDSLINHIPLEYRMKDLAYLSSDIREYKKLVSKYKEEQDKSLKNEITKKIKQITDKLERSMIDKSIERWNNQIKRLKDEISQQTLNFNVGSFIKNKDNKEAKEKIKKIQEKIVESEKKKEIFGNSFEWAIEFPDLLDEDSNFIGFDVMVLNPPYISTKEVNSMYNKEQISHINLHFFKKKNNGKCLFTDLYELFFYRCFELLKKGGYLGIITSDSYLTMLSYIRLRKELLKKGILNLLPCALNTFKNEGGGPSVSTSILISKNQEPDTPLLVYNRFEDINKFDINTLEKYEIDLDIFRKSIRFSFFIPNKRNMLFYKKHMEKWIREYEIYRKDKLKASELLGALTVGGRGIDTGNNGFFLAIHFEKKVDESNFKEMLKTKLFKIKIEKIKKFILENNNLHTNLLIDELRKNFKDSEIAYNAKSREWGVYKFISNDIINTDLTEKEKSEGIKGEKIWVPFDKIEGESDIYYAPIKYYINWSENQVKWYKTNSGKNTKYGMPMIRNLDLQFKDGIIFGLTTSKRILRARLSHPFLFYGKSPKLIPLNEKEFPIKYLLGFINSEIAEFILKTFLNNTVSNQIDDVRLIYTIVPKNEDKRYIIDRVNKCIEIKKKELNEIELNNKKYTLYDLEKEINERLFEIYDINKNLFEEE